MEAIQVYLVDDHAPFRQSTAFALQAEGIQVQEFASGREFVATLLEAKVRPLTACIVTDLRMPDGSGIELMESLWRHRVQYPVIMVSGHADIPLAVEAMRRGAAHFLEKPFDQEKLFEAIRHAVTSPMNGLRNPVESFNLLSKLSPRERQVLELVCAGKLNKTIADVLGISIKTVELHRANMSNKLGVRNVQDLMKLTLGYA